MTRVFAPHTALTSTPCMSERATQYRGMREPGSTGSMDARPTSSATVSSEARPLIWRYEPGREATRGHHSNAPTRYVVVVASAVTGSGWWRARALGLPHREHSPSAGAAQQADDRIAVSTSLRSLHAVRAYCANRGSMCPCFSTTTPIVVANALAYASRAGVMRDISPTSRSARNSAIRALSSATALASTRAVAVPSFSRMISTFLRQWPRLSPAVEVERYRSRCI
jgi:hypothetical protein